MIITEKDIERFHTKYEVKSKEECWPYKGGLFKLGYGAFKLDGQNRLAHRIAYQLFYGKFNQELVVRHLCFNKICVNPHHLCLGTDKDNMNDGDIDRVGENNGFNKLTGKDVKSIRENYANGVTQDILARNHKVSQVTISKVILGKTWSHVN